jgi:hypothetical protein
VYLDLDVYVMCGAGLGGDFARSLYPLGSKQNGHHALTEFGMGQDIIMVGVYV